MIKKHIGQNEKIKQVALQLHNEYCNYTDSITFVKNLKHEDQYKISFDPSWNELCAVNGMRDAYLVCDLEELKQIHAELGKFIEEVENA